MAKEKRKHLSKHRKLFTAATATATVALLAFDYVSGINSILAWFIAIAALIVSGEMITVLNGLNGGYGMYMIGSRHGISFIDSISKKHQRLWTNVADIGLVLSLGLLSFVVFRHRMSKKKIAFGMVALVLLFVFVFTQLQLAMNFINIPKISSMLASESSSASAAPSIEGYTLGALTVAGGFSVLTFSAILYNAVKIMVGLSVYLASLFTAHPNTGAISSQIAGVAPVIPGIDMPLLAGIISLVILLIVHEFSHGVLARIAKVKLKSIGLVLLGVVPAGAYVEPEEKEIKKLDKTKQERIFVAGVTSNMVLSVIFFALMLVMAYAIMPGIEKTVVEVYSTIPNYPAYNVIAPGSIVEEWNGYPIRNLSSFVYAARNDTPFSTVSVVTNNGSYSFRTNSTGKIGVYIAEKEIVDKGIAGSVGNFFYVLFALSFLLNFLVAIVNLLPIPGFDGWQIYKLEINSKALNILGAIVIIALVVNVLPWFFY
ncbi:MAG: site-2 protease family protein [Candidatus Micrarchaeia archaeon]